MMVSSLIATLCILSGVCASPQSFDDFNVQAEPRIVGGYAINITEASYQVALLKPSQGGPRLHCGGSIIGHSVILTAAHCTQDRNATNLAVRAGSSYHEHGGQIIQVKRIEQYPFYDHDTSDNDISLLFLSSRLTFGPEAQTIKLPTQGQAVPDNATAVITGWGILHPDGSTARQLHKAEVSIVDHNSCVKAYFDNDNNKSANITDTMICAGKLNVDACQGDSGGPLVVDGLLVGVTSWGHGCANPQKPGVYAKVAEFRDWIDSNVNQ